MEGGKGRCLEEFRDKPSLEQLRTELWRHRIGPCGKPMERLHVLRGQVAGEGLSARRQGSPRR